MKRLLRWLYPVRRFLLRVMRWRTQGVKVMLFDADGALLLVRHSYGRSDLLMLPGGGIEKGEQPAAAAAREMKEELGIAVQRLAPFGTYASEQEGRRDTVHLFTGHTVETPKADGREIAEAMFVRLDALPDTVSPATLRRIAEYRGEQPVGKVW